MHYYVKCENIFSALVPQRGCDSGNYSLQLNNISGQPVLREAASAPHRAREDAHGSASATEEMHRMCALRGAQNRAGWTRAAAQAAAGTASKAVPVASVPAQIGGSAL